jgi:ribosomal protein S18 acetylase RimI-like enzyme
MSDIKYRQLCENDFEKIYDVAFEAWNYTYKDIYIPSKIKEYVDKFYTAEELQKHIPYIKKGETSFEVAEEENSILGFCNIQVRDNEKAELIRIYLKPSHIGKGIGKKLLLNGEEFLISKKIKKIYCYAQSENKIGHKFYLRNGFKMVATEPNELFDNECDYKFEKEL